ncbi:flippase [Haloarcula marismortui]|uniref:Flippase n=1 Tax=Haloarcula marismortui ATCC 33800 TaxID=662476 RepID=M0JXL6_9EURY|nr:flippase [Haloarcula sinaiiensis]EMA13887.1 membrane protein involved in the export of O-antigen and teichoic acid [Haloarcula sinaiiensis ATCC 33800]QUJ73134.1 flippase [Haloarcula sinaiiensis ATCC 33800]
MVNIARSGLKLFFARISKSLVEFLAIIIFSRELGASPLGTYYPFLALLGILAIPTDFGISSAIEKRISEGSDESEYLGTAIVLKVPLLIFISISILVAHQYVIQYLGADLTISLIATLFASQAAKLSMTALRGERRVGETAIVEVLRPLGWLGMGYALYLNGYGVYALVYGYLFGSVLMLVVGWWKVSVSVAKPTFEHARSLLDYGRYSVVSAVGGYFYSWMDVAMLSVFVSISAGAVITRGDIGAYENAWRLSLVVMLLSQSIATALFPQVSKWNAEGAMTKIEEIIPTALLPALLFVIPAFAGTAVLSKDLLRILFSPEFTVAWLVLIILAGEKILQAVHVVLGRSLQAIDRPDLAAYATVVSVAVNLILNLVLIYQFGIVGAAIATTVSFAINTALHARYLNRFLDIDFPTREAVWSTVAATVMGISVYGVHSAVQIVTIIDLFAVILFGAAVYTAVVLIYRPIREETQRLIGPVIQNIS